MKLRKELCICHHLNNNRNNCSSNGKQMQASVCADHFLLALACVCNLQVVSLHKHF